jgi:hypothetical protein
MAGGMGGDAFEDSCAGDLGSPFPGAMGEVGVEGAVEVLSTDMTG